MDRKYNRVLIKLSGEAIGKENGRGIDNNKLEKVVYQIVKISQAGTQIAIVLGGGNFWRGRYGDKYMERTTSDYMGMLGTIINAVAVKASLINNGLDAQVLSAIEVKQLAKQFTKERALKALSKGKVLIFAGGTGNPYFTTDTCAALRANEVGCDAILMAKNGVEGVYSDDPRTNKDAKFIHLVENLTEEYESMAKESTGSNVGTGGMNTKLIAAKIATKSGADMLIANSADVKILSRLIAGSEEGTLFLGNKDNNFDIKDFMK